MTYVKDIATWQYQQQPKTAAVYIQEGQASLRRNKLTKIQLSRMQRFAAHVGNWRTQAAHKAL